MSEELKKYKVLKQLGWNKSVYAEGDTVEMEPRFAEYYISEKVLEEADGASLVENEAAYTEPEKEKVIAPSLTTETEEV